jgi:hypothetical protein
MIKRKELEELYWGESCMPSHWHTIGEISTITKLDPHYIKTALNGYGIPIRTEAEELHRDVWQLLSDEFGLIPNSDFFYNTKLESYDVNFLLHHDQIGIRITNRLPVRHTESISIGDAFLVKISSKGGPEEVTQSLRKTLLGYKVRARRLVEDRKDELW